jgi:hypothetical protein
MKADGISDLSQMHATFAHSTAASFIIVSLKPIYLYYDSSYTHLT